MYHKKDIKIKMSPQKVTLQPHSIDLSHSRKGYIEVTQDEQPKKIKYFRNESYNVGAYSDYLNKKQAPKEIKNNRLQKINKIFKQLTIKHQQTKKKLQKLKEQKQSIEKSLIQSYSFQPQINHKPQYRVSSSMHQRNKSWDQARAKKYSAIKSAIDYQKYKECTFKPELKSNFKFKIKRQSLTKQQMENLLVKRRAQNKFMIVDFKTQHKRKLQSFDYKMIKSLIHNEMVKIVQ